MKYSTVTSKGQITLPASLRKSLNITSGKKVAIDQKEGVILIFKPQNIQDVRKQLKNELIKNGTYKTSIKSGDGWTSNVKDKHGKY